MANRRKKSIQMVKARIKKANSKRNSASKPKYVCKAERAKLAEQDSCKDSESRSISDKT